MKVFLIYMVLQWIYVIFFLHISVLMYKVEPIGGLILLILTLIEALKLFYDWDGDFCPKNYNQNREIARLLVIKSSYIILTMFGFLIMYYSIDLLYQVLGLLLIVISSIKSDVNVKFYKVCQLDRHE